jgi:CspA family cold shock protein
MIFQKLKAFFTFSTPENTKKPLRKEGTIKYFNRKRGFGFIRSNQTVKDIFVHVRDLKGSIHKGDRVKFQVEESDKGLRARNVEVVQM